ncbi:MAG: hypothetical protein K2Q22_00415, partial [Cytophagales bacterium]|nr:hypothetical protein [Cytophagales bacterium]
MNANAEITKTENLSWKGQIPVLTNEAKEVKRLYFLGAVYTEESNFNPMKTFFIENLNSSTFKLQDEVYQPLTASEIGSVDESAVTSNISIRFIETFQNGNPLIKVELIPLRKNPGTGLLEKLVSFSYSFDQNYQSKRISNSSARTSAYGASSSVLATGKWYKISLNKDGIYKMDYSFLQSLGIDPKTINPKNIQLYGNGCKMLPQPNATPRADDLIQNAIKVIGEEDNSFDSNDYIIFYGQSPDSWSFDSTNQVFNHSKNIYSDYSYYFLTVSDSPGKRISDVSNFTGSSNTINIFNERQFHETDSYNLLHSGREWYGELFDYQNSQNFSFPVNSYDANGKIVLSASFMCKSSTQQYNSNSFSISVNGALMGSVSPAGSVGVLLSAIGIQRNGTFTKALSQIPSGNLTVNVTYNNSNSPLVSGYLNWLEINLTRPLAFSSTQCGFRSMLSRSYSDVQYSINNSSNNLT